MNLKEFRDFGYLQEANRRFFHPLGLALAVTVTETTGEVGGLVIFDERQDKEGFIFTVDDPPEQEKYERVQAEWVERCAVRMEALGYGIQPVDGGLT